jgi:hypothetical protein
MVSGGMMLPRTYRCCRREFVYGIEYQVLGIEPVYCRSCGEHHQHLALAPKTRKPRTRKAAKAS